MRIATPEELSRRVTTVAEYMQPVRDVATLALAGGNFIPNRHGREFKPHVEVPEDLVARLFAIYGLSVAKPEPVFGNFVGHHFLDGAEVHLHRDPAPDGFCHVRCNVAVQMPLQGGNPILSGIEYPVSEGEVWICFASIENHATTPLLGGERLTLSVGGLVEAVSARKAFRRIVLGVLNEA